MGTEAEANYLRANGYKARAIGLPIAYLSDHQYSRKPRTLLVMPAHSMEYNRHQWRFREYAEAIAAIRSEFDTVVVCVHPACIKNGYWIHDFQALGFPVISGAHLNDHNALERVRALMSQFEFVTTNDFGSQLAYASAFGAKVSIYGDFCRIRLADYEEDNFYMENPGLLEKVLPRLSEAATREAFPDLFCRPAQAQERTAWGLRQIGHDIRITPAEMKRCFEWDRLTPWIRSVRRRIRAASAGCVPTPVKRQLKVALNKNRKTFETEVARMRSLPPLAAGECTLQGQHFHFADAATFLGTHRAIFVDRCYDFPCVKGGPRIIDCGANIGLAVRFWVQKYPAAQITAFEPDPGLFALLKKNCQHLPQGQIALHEAAVWNADSSARSQSTGFETGHLATVGRSVTGQGREVRTVRLHDFLDQEVDFLKIDIEGAETEVLIDCTPRLTNVRRLYVEFHSYLGESQRLGEILQLLAQTGFRYHIVPSVFSPSPLIELTGNCGMDQRIDVWAYRGVRFPRTIVA